MEHEDGVKRATERLGELLALAHADQGAGRMRLLVPTPELAEAAAAVKAGQGALHIRPGRTGWSIELTVAGADGEQIRIRLPEDEAGTEEAALACARGLLAGLLDLAVRALPRPMFTLYGTAVPLLPEALAAGQKALAGRMTENADQLHARLEALLAAHLPDGFSVVAFDRLADTARRLVLAELHRAAIAGIREHPRQNRG